ncbi:MAG: pyruvate ferredoxin oxidoreductase [Candidatus Diapherotrites archaeon]|nr:pyruvate ferredoxin oxidoreductase [Candidatus Diapherotrites archaeon]
MALVTIEGAKALGDVAANCSVDVCACYPITPTTHLTEQLNKHYANGKIPQFIAVESEFAALSALVGASAVGARAFTTTGGQGLLLMHEVLFSAAGMRLPMVMVVGNRAVSSPLNIWNDEQDSISQRDSGWIQIYCKSNQEAVDSVPQAFFISEKTSIPVMVCVDGHYLTHAVEQIDIPQKKEIAKFLPAFNPKIILDPKNPVSMGVYATPEHYQMFRQDLHADLEKSAEVIKEAGEKFGKIFGREYGLVKEFYCEDADRIIVGLGSVMDNAIAAVKKLRERGEKVGALHLRVFRPFPKEELKKILEGKKVGVLERDISAGGTPPVYAEVTAALNGTNSTVSSFFGGLGGRGIKHDEIMGLFEKMKQDGPLHEWIATKSLSSMNVGC